jgi:hypothetical protein
MNLLEACPIKTLRKSVGKIDHRSLEDRPSKGYEHSMSNPERGSEQQRYGVGERAGQMTWDDDIREEDFRLCVWRGCLRRNHAAL